MCQSPAGQNGFSVCIFHFASILLDCRGFEISHGMMFIAKVIEIAQLLRFLSIKNKSQCYVCLTRIVKSLQSF